MVEDGQVSVQTSQADESSQVRSTAYRREAYGLILGEHYGRLCGISFSHAASNSSRLEILAQRGDAQALLSRTRYLS